MFDTKLTASQRPLLPRLLAFVWRSTASRCNDTSMQSHLSRRIIHQVNCRIVVTVNFKSTFRTDEGAISKP